MKLFYSWQSDITQTGKIIEKALKIVRKTIEFDLDSDTRDNPGSPDITRTILNKIDNSNLFLADVTIINMEEKGRKSPNPNVIFELGYAVHSLSEENVVMIADRDIATDKEFPFDIRNRKIKFISFSADNAKEQIAQIITKAINKSVPVSDDQSTPVVFFGNDDVKWANWGAAGGTFTGFKVDLELDNYHGESDYITNICLFATDSTGSEWQASQFKINETLINKPFAIPPDNMMSLTVLLSDDFNNHRLMPDLDTDSARIIVTYRSKKTTILAIKPTNIGNN